jgi:SAM-dependent methyltransferase
MNLLDVVRRRLPPEPWAEGEKIPWSDPGFSQRMLKEHLRQDHDAASRRFVIIEQHVAWIHDQVLSGRPTRILDLGCGPGLYTSRLARLGHTCVGIDYAPAAIAYARQQAERERLKCTYLLEDIRSADYGTGYGLVMFVHGEFNAFRRADAERILRKAYRALTDGGLLLLEPHTFSAVQQVGEAHPSWYSAEAGLFSDRPHVCLQESFWDAERRTATERYMIIDALTGDVTRHASTMQAYTRDEYRSLLGTCGFSEVAFHDSLAGTETVHAGLFALVARKRCVS